MRPINLIPENERRSHGTVTRTGPLAYILVGALAVLLVGVVLMVLTSNQISDRQNEVTSLESERTAATAQAESLAPYVSFEQVAESRTQTIGELAESRFDWERVIRQLALILPPRVYLTSLTGSAGGGGGEEEEEASVGVPSLSIAGCAPGQAGVAGFVAALKEIDGVTRVGLGNSATTSGSQSEGGDESGGAASGACETPGVYTFQILVVFDGAPPSPDSGAALELAEVAPEAEASTEGESSTEGETSSEPATAESSESTTGTASASTPEGTG